MRSPHRARTWLGGSSRARACGSIRYVRHIAASRMDARAIRPDVHERFVMIVARATAAVLAEEARLFGRRRRPLSITRITAPAPDPELVVHDQEPLLTTAAA